MNPPSDALLQVLVIDDDEQHLKFMTRALAQDDVVITTIRDPRKAVELVQSQRPQLVLVDLVMPGVSGMEVLENIVSLDPTIEVVLLTGHYSTDSAVEAIQKGASDYLTKPVPIQKLKERVDSMLAELRGHQRRLQLDNELVENYQFAGMVGRSPLMSEVFHRVRRVAQHYRTVLVTGETGVGKELVAQALHRLSPVASGPLLICNCSSFVETLAESELFGHVKGAFTGAIQDRLGVFESANGGTVLLDEVGELSLPVQAKLLRVLQNQEIQRVGSPTVRKIDIRVIAATHRDLQGMVKEHRFREDLFYRLSVVQIKVPSLAQRKEDLPLLQRYFLRRFSTEYQKPLHGITPRAQALLARYRWPGNIRELENVLGSACMMTETEAIDVEDLPEYIRAARLTETGPENQFFGTLEQMERGYTLRVLESVNGNKFRAAELLGISRAKLYRILGGSEPSNADNDLSNDNH